MEGGLLRMGRRTPARAYEVGRQFRRLKRKTKMEQNQKPTLGQIAEFVNDKVVAGARVQQDKGRVIYTADIHRALAAYAMAEAMKRFTLSPDASTLRMLLAMVDNHSAWRQRLEKAKVFPKKEDRPADAGVDELLAELEEEGV